MIYFDALTQADCEQIRGWRNDDISGARTPYLLTGAQQGDFYRNVVSDRDSKHRYWAIRGHEDINEKRIAAIAAATRSPSTVWESPDRCIGIAGLTDIEWENGRAEIALMIDPDKRGKGHGKTSLDELYMWGFERMRLHTLYGNVYACNPSFVFWERMIMYGEMIHREVPYGKWWAGKWWATMYFQMSLEQWER